MIATMPRETPTPPINIHPESENFRDVSETEAFAEAHKINKAVKEGLATPAEAERGSQAELEDIVRRVDERFIQKAERPDKFWERTPGHEAEEKVIAILMRYFKDTGGVFFVRDATISEDQTGKRIDLYVGITGEKVEIPVQVTTSKRPEIHHEKARKTGHDVVMVIIPGMNNETMRKPLPEMNGNEMRNVASPFLLQLLEGVHEKYPHVYADILPRLAQAHQKSRPRGGRLAV